MAYTMTHILIAEIVLEYFDCTIDYPTYMVGIIAPDAVHANPDYSRELKEKSHIFAEGLKWGEVSSKNELDDWFDCVKEFYGNNHFKYDRDFFLGYIVHILTDICSCKEIYVPFYNALTKDEMVEKKKQFSHESYLVNYYLYCEYSKNKNLMDILKKGCSYSITNVYDDTFFDNRISQLLDFEFKSWDLESIENNSIVTVKNTRALLENAPEMIRQMLVEIGVASRL